LEKEKEVAAKRRHVSCKIIILIGLMVLGLLLPSAFRMVVNGSTDCKHDVHYDVESLAE